MVSIIAVLWTSALVSTAIPADAITITATPALPVQNLVHNAGFEERSEFPARDRTVTSAPFWQLYRAEDTECVTDEESHTGRYSYKFVGNTELSKFIRQRDAGKGILKEPLKKGTEIILSAWSKSTGANPKGKSYGLSTQIHGKWLGGPSFKKSEHDWQYAEDVIALPAEKTHSVRIYIAYYNQTGIAYFDDVFLGLNKTKLTLKAALPNLKRVTVIDDQDKQVFDSDVLPENTNTFEKTIDVRTRRIYTVKIEDTQGNTCTRRYPEPGTAIDLAALHKAGKVTVETNMQCRSPNFPAMGAASVFDGSTDYGSGVYESTDGPAVFTLKLGKPRAISRIGVGLKPGSTETGSVSILIGDKWETVKQYVHAQPGTIDAIQLTAPQTISAVKIELTDCPGLKALTELQLFEDPGVVSAE